MKIISHDNKKWIVSTIIEVSRIDDPKITKKNWGADIVLRRGNLYYFCKEIIDAEFKEIAK